MRADEASGRACACRLKWQERVWGSTTFEGMMAAAPQKERRAPWRPVCLVVSSLVCLVVSKAQPYWAKDVGGLGADHVADVRTDGQGSIYVAGEFANSFTYDGVTLVSAGGIDGFVAKLDALGDLEWMVRCGGLGTDRAVKLDVDGGQVVVTGQFTGTADLFGTALTSAGGTVDVFVAKLDAGTGALQWVRQGGSDVWAERAYGITLTPNGHVTITGEFKGTADFSGQSITSLIDPLTLQYGFDVFIASYDGTGALLWLQQGAASHADRGVDVGGDAAGNIYVCGQYSDTITFDVMHPGLAFNATFLVKFDAAGQEQWFRRAGGGSFNHVRDLQVTDGGGIVLCGDLQGTMVFEDSSPDPVPAGAPHAVYLLHVDADGELLGQRVLGSDAPLGSEGLVQQGGAVALLGTFACGLTGLQAQYGDGVFQAVGDPDMFVARYTFPALQPMDAQQFGGRGGKQAGRIAALPGGALVFCGSYTEDLVIPSDGGTWGEAPFSSGSAGFCGDPAYDRYTQNFSSGLSDGFVARAYVVGRQPYDIWERSGTCQRPMLDLCVRSQAGALCPQQIDTCSAFLLGLHTPFNWTDPFLPPQPGQGPMMEFLWSAGSTTPYAAALTTGWYWCTMTADNGCWSVTDSVYVSISTPPDATISDGLYVNWAADNPQPLTPCDTTVWLWCPTLQPGDQVQWTLPGGSVVANDSVLATVSGGYLVTVTAPNGCTDVAQILVTMSQSDPLPNVTGVDITLYDPLGGVLDGDTVAGCSFGGVLGQADVQFYIDSLPGVIPNNVFVAVNSSGLPGGSITTPNGPFYWSVSAFQGTGWYPITFTINIFDSPCPSDTITFMMQDSIYWVQVDEPVASFPDTVLLCPGDTSVLAVQCAGCDLVLWQGPGIVSTTAGGDTAWVNAYGYYQLTLQASVPWGGCAFNNYIAVVPPVTPTVFTLPPDGLICPGDTALLVTTTPGAQYVWEGPDGPLNVNNDTVAVTELGDYYLQVTDAGGCVLGAGPLTIAGIGTPFVSTVGDNVLCPGDSVTVEVVGGSGTNVQWQAPLQGSAPVQVIDAPGLYTCWVTSCGITTLLSIPIGLSQPEATITAPQPAVTCDGLPVVLQGTPGMSAYLWMPGAASTPDLAVTQQGYYQLIVTDAYGCIDTSAYQFVGGGSIAQPLTATGDSVCAGEGAVLLASGSGAITWYADAQAQQVVGVGGSLATGPIGSDTVLFVQQVDGPCTGAVIAVPVVVLEAPAAPVLAGDEALCLGSSGMLLATGPAAATFTWTAPWGSVNGDTLMLNAPVQPGTYACVATVDGCPGDAATIAVSVEECGLVIPNVFSPNGDGVNDAFVLESPTGAPLELVVHNRWGQVVFTQRAALVRWNGSHRSGERVSEGVYYYVLTLEGAGGPLVHTGHVQVVH